jgi:hypothetical protein
MSRNYCPSTELNVMGAWHGDRAEEIHDEPTNGDPVVVRFLESIEDLRY